MTARHSTLASREAGLPGESGRQGWRATELGGLPWLRAGVETQFDRAIVNLVGDLDVASAETLGESMAGLVDAGSTRIVVDVSDLAFCDASGIGALVRVAQRAARHGGWLRIAAARPLMERIIRITGLTRTLPVYATVEDALADRADLPRGVAGGYESAS
jgi:anti-sigma B factor antagonist